MVDLASLRQEFPVMQQLLYLDAAHQAPLAMRVRDAMIGFLTEGHRLGGPKPVWLSRVEQVRARVAGFLGARPDEIAFTKNTSEGLNIAANAMPLREGDNVLLVAGDHPNNAYAWLHLRRKGVDVRFVDVPDGEVANAETFERHVDDRTRVITLSHVTFHAGQCHDIASIGRFCRTRGIHLVLDAMQSAGVVPIDVEAMGISVLAAGCHKGLLVPQGLGVLVVRHGLDELQPAFVAMASLAHPPADYVARPDDMTTRRDAARFEIGNLNLPAIHALDAALALIEEAGVARIHAHALDLGDRLVSHMDALGVRAIGPRRREDRAHIVVLDLPGATPTAWAGRLAADGVRVSPERGGIRVSFGLFNDESDVDRFAGLVRRHLA